MSTVGSPTGLRWEGEQAQAGKREPPSQTESSKHVAGVRRGTDRAGICKQKDCQGDPEEAAEVMGHWRDRSWDAESHRPFAPVWLWCSSRSKGLKKISLDRQTWARFDLAALGWRGWESRQE